MLAASLRKWIYLEASERLARLHGILGFRGLAPFSRRLGGASRAVTLGVALFLMVALGGAFSGCGSLPARVASVPSRALPPSLETPLGRIAKASTPSVEQSGVRLIPLGLYSLEARVQLAQRAQHSLDLQYYVLENDPSGRLLLRQLRDAALRGVRVRLLVDDLYTTHTDQLLRQLAAHPNVEVRLFNPFCCARSRGVLGRYAASLFDFGRLNHRMHNKMFIADGVMALVGGRNIADEYFQRSSEQNFVDMDAFVMGKVVGDMASIFDQYWNSEVVVPIEAVDGPASDRQTAQADFAQTIDSLPQAALLDPPSVDVLGYGPLGEDLEAGKIGLIWGTARAFADPPEKQLRESAAEAFKTSVTNDVMMTIWRASGDLVLTSPYLIPGDKGVQSIDDLRKKGVKVTIVTNSLAATDEPLVHFGYARYRPAMLKAGVDLYELSPTRAQRTKRLGLFGKSLGRLHAKTAIIDGKRIFIGSMNLDPRSANANTEFGMFIESPAAAKELLRVINISKLQSAYRVRIDPAGSALQWLTVDDDQEMILGVEPESTRWLRLQNFIFGQFVPEQLL